MSGPAVEEPAERATAGTGPPARIRISDTVVARLAARRTLAVPGVLALQADIGQAMLGIAGSVLEKMALRPPPAGASAEVRDGAVAIRLTVVTMLGHNCRDLAQAIQREVAAEVIAFTGLATSVTVTVADVVINESD